MISRKKRNLIMPSLCHIYYKDYRDKINLYAVKEETKLPYEEIIQIAINLESQGYLKYLSPKEVKETKTLDDGKNRICPQIAYRTSLCFFNRYWEMLL